MLCDIRYADYRLGACIALSQAFYLMGQHQSYLSMSALKDSHIWHATWMGTPSIWEGGSSSTAGGGATHTQGTHLYIYTHIHALTGACTPPLLPTESLYPAIGRHITCY